MSGDEISNSRKHLSKCISIRKYYCVVISTQTPGFEHMFRLDLKILDITYFLEKMIVEHGG